MHTYVSSSKYVCDYVMCRGLQDLTEAVCPGEERTLRISNSVNL